ncbi:ParA family protein [Rhodomicrobium vannielii ATCC 17100]|uniref:ParA family protein n=1 Tax=Rhodomicrobium vannielii TaxID=1069 RepID=UPI001919CDE3|nr:ParA family protein [Rhodomicrobium vannielii]MBJ7534457.1 ParA family protein [Rhodomicrobium vannielii ATCC 17100]
MSIWTTIEAPVVSPPGIPVLVVGNLKGGVGKTTIVAHLSAGLVSRGVRVLAIDLDFQASLSVAFPSGVVPLSSKADGSVNALVRSSYDVFNDWRFCARGHDAFSRLALVPTSLELADVEDLLFARFVLGKHTDDDRFALARKLADPRLSKDFDVVIIDTPPRLTTATINALCACSHVLIPTSLTPLSDSGAVTFAAFLSKFKARLCPRIQILSIVPTLTRGALNFQEQNSVNRIKTALPGVPVWDDVFIPRRQAIADNNISNPESREIFGRLAERVKIQLGLRETCQN